MFKYILGMLLIFSSIASAHVKTTGGHEHAAKTSADQHGKDHLANDRYRKYTEAVLTNGHTHNTGDGHHIHESADLLTDDEYIELHPKLIEASENIDHEDDALLDENTHWTWAFKEHAHHSHTLTFTDGASATRTVEEDTPAGQDIGDPVTATVDNTTDPNLEYMLEGTDASAFAIDAKTGQLKTKDPLVHATKDTYSVTVKVHFDHIDLAHVKSKCFLRVLI